MFRQRFWCLVAAGLSLAVLAAAPASALAHALAHYHDQTAHQHLRSLGADDPHAELSAPDDPGGHPHVRLDRGARTCSQQVLPGLPAAEANPVFDLAPGERIGLIPSAAEPIPDPGGGDPPRVRAPPLL